MPKQKLKNYDGSITGQVKDSRYTYPGGQVLDTPGGTNNIETHWTGGHGGKGDVTTSTHVHNSDKYLATNYGNLYKKNSDTVVHEEEKIEFIEEDISNNLSTSLELAEPQSNIENYQHTKLTEMPPSKDEKQENHTIKTILVAIIFMVWGCFLCVFMEQFVHKNVRKHWIQYLVYAISATVLILLIIQSI